MKSADGEWGSDHTTKFALHFNSHPPAGADCVLAIEEQQRTDSNSEVIPAPCILFPCSPLNRKEVEPEYATERDAAEAAGSLTALYSHEQLDANQLLDALRDCPSGRLYLLRGWMMTEDLYANLEAALVAKQSKLVTSRMAYAEAHYLPLGYRHLEGNTPRSEWIEGDDPTEAWRLYQSFVSEDAVIKDWVKSAKHRWKEACFIPAQCSEVRFGEIFRNFREARGHLFNRGVVIRKFERLATHGNDLRGFPLVEEYRLFFFHGRLLAYPDFEQVHEVLAHGDRWHALAARFASPFLSMDIARLETGGWTVIEVGDGGVSGLPLSIDPGRFYSALFDACR